jgi:hypothetical protein
MRAGGWLGRAARSLAREWRRLEDQPAAGIQAQVLTGVMPLPATPAVLETDEKVLRALARLREASGWDRLEIGRRPDDGAVYGYCVATPGGRSVDTAVALESPGTPEVILRLREVFLVSGWQRLEAVSDRRGTTGGWCERADGSGVSWPARHARIVTKVTSIDHPGDWIHVAGPEQEAPGGGG